MVSSFSVPVLITSFKLRMGALLLLFGIASAGLYPTFYDKTCPKALPVIKSAVKAAVANEPRMGASLLRLHFHDCFVQGCDGSVLLDGPGTEKTAPPNINSVRGFEVIDAIKAQLETICPGVVSCADILTLTARDSVVALGGPSWTVLLGRRDSTTANFSGAVLDLPAPTSDLNALISSFLSKGFTPKELVALSGGHTIGGARCTTFRDRIYNETNIDPSYATSLKAICPLSRGDNNLANLDVSSPTAFDNAYFKNLLSKKGLLHSDQQLFNGGITDSQVQAYSCDGNSFRNDFAKAMVKMGNLRPLLFPFGQIRTNCRKVN